MKYNYNEHLTAAQLKLGHLIGYFSYESPYMDVDKVLAELLEVAAALRKLNKEVK